MNLLRKLTSIRGNKLINLLYICAISFALTACTDTPPVTSGTGTTNMKQSDLLSQHLKVDNESLHEKLKITELKTRITNDFLELNIELSNNYEKSLKLQYHFNWFDKDGFVIESRKSPWKPLELHGMQSTMIKGVAPSIHATQFNIYVREVPLKVYEF